MARPPPSPVRFTYFLEAPYPPIPVAMRTPVTESKRITTRHACEGLHHGRLGPLFNFPKWTGIQSFCNGAPLFASYTACIIAKRLSFFQIASTVFDTAASLRICRRSPCCCVCLHCLSPQPPAVPVLDRPVSASAKEMTAKM